ncbi:hypothetical protein CCP3SC15_2130002 [Gammaproteobacteria bacterium]
MTKLYETQEEAEADVNKIKGALTAAIDAVEGIHPNMFVYALLEVAAVKANGNAEMFNDACQEVLWHYFLRDKEPVKAEKPGLIVVKR